LVHPFSVLSVYACCFLQTLKIAPEYRYEYHTLSHPHPR